MISPTVAASKWQRNLSQATESIKQGVQAVTVSPTAKAVLAIDRQVAGVQRAAAEGKTKRGLERVSLEDWKQSMLTKGIQRVQSGAAAAQPKMEAFLTEFLPHVEAGVRQLDSMPRGDMETNIGRAVSMMRHNARFQRRT